MLHSSLINNIIKEEGNPLKERESKVQEIVERLKDPLLSSQDLKLKKEKTLEENLNRIDKQETLFGFFSAVFVSLVTVSVIEFFENLKMESKMSSGEIFGLALFIGCLYFVSFISANYYGKEKRIIENIIFRKKDLKELFQNLADKPYEIRLDLVEGSLTKFKIIVEENQETDGHVIKEKSGHITAYLDASKKMPSVVYFVQELVKKAEAKFK